MEKEKFDRNAPHVNIGEIAKKHAGENEARMNITSSAIDFAISNNEKYNQQVLQDLIKQYGEVEGKNKFKTMLEEEKKRFEEIQKLDLEIDNETKSSDLKR